MDEPTVVKHTCIQSACFFLPFFEAGEWRRRGKSPWKSVKKDGVWMETETMIYEDILPRLEEAGISENDYALYSEYTRKWGMI